MICSRSRRAFRSRRATRVGRTARRRRPRVRRGRLQSLPAGGCLRAGDALGLGGGQRGLHDGIGVQRGNQTLAQFSHGNTTAGLFDARLRLVVQLFGQTHQAVGEREHGVVVAAAHRHALQQVFQRHAGLLLQRAAFGLEGFLHAHGVDQHEAGLGAFCAVADALEAVAIQAAHAAALHLLVVALAAHVSHEQQHFQRLDVGAGGDHVHGDGNARVVVVAKAAEDAVGVFFGAVGDLLAEGVPWTVDLAQDVDDVVGVAVGLGKDQGLGRLFARGEDLRFHGGFHGLDHLRIWLTLTTERSSSLPV
jgi:hypothetical protein